MYRLVWSPTRYFLVGGYWAHLGKCAYIPARLYEGEPRWVLEKFKPVDDMDPTMWDVKTVAEQGYSSLGPLPVYGDYYECFRFTMGVGPDGYVPVDPRALELAARLVDMGKHVTFTNNRIAARDRMLAKDAEWDKMVDGEWDEAQHVRHGLSIGAGGAVDPGKEYDEYERTWRKQRGLTNNTGLQQI